MKTAKGTKPTTNPTTGEGTHPFQVGTFWEELLTEDNWTFRGMLIPAKYDGEIEVAVILNVSFNTAYNTLTLRSQKKFGNCKTFLKSTTIPLDSRAAESALKWDRNETQPDTTPSENDIRIRKDYAKNQADLGRIEMLRLEGLEAQKGLQVVDRFIYDPSWITNQTEEYLDLENDFTLSNVENTLELRNRITFHRLNGQDLNHPGHKDLCADLHLNESHYRGGFSEPYNGYTVSLRIDDALRMIASPCEMALTSIFEFTNRVGKGDLFVEYTPDDYPGLSPVMDWWKVKRALAVGNPDDLGWDDDETSCEEITRFDDTDEGLCELKAFLADHAQEQNTVLVVGLKHYQEMSQITNPILESYRGESNIEA